MTGTLPPTNMAQLLRAHAKEVEKLRSLLGSLGRDKTYPSSQRPDPTTKPAGSRIFDITLSKPLWCTGTAWVDATGTPV